MRGCAVRPINAVSLNNCAAKSRARPAFTMGQRTVECEPRGAGGALARNGLPQRHHAHSNVAAGVHTAAAGTGAAPTPAVDTLSWGAGAECEVSIPGGAYTGADTHNVRRRLRVCATRAALNVDVEHTLEQRLPRDALNSLSTDSRPNFLSRTTAFWLRVLQTV